MKFLIRMKKFKNKKEADDTRYSNWQLKFAGSERHADSNLWLTDIRRAESKPVPPFRRLTINNK
jgi:hypothetical protein